MSNVEFAAFVIQAFPAVVDPFVEVAGQLAATWFELSAPASTYVAVTAPPLPIDRLIQSARWALGGDGMTGLSRLEGTTQRAVFDGARDTILVNVERTNARWARYASANACSFCRLMATRGSTYRSSESAAKNYHDDDRCIAVEDRDGTYEPPEYVDQWQSEYIQARRDAGSGDPKQILAAWRQLDGVDAK